VLVVVCNCTIRELPVCATFIAAECVGEIISLVDSEKLKDIILSELEAVAPQSQGKLSGNAVKVLSKSCELFILELTMRTYENMQGMPGDNMIKEEDVMRAIRGSETYDMLTP